MGLDFFREAVRLQREFLPDRFTSNSLQTNGTLLDDEWAVFLKENRFLTGISIDGPRELHDRFRRDSSGAGTHERVLRGRAALENAGAEYNVLTLVSAANQDYPAEVYEYLKSLGVRYHQYIECVEFDAAGKRAPFALGPGKWGEFLCGIFDAWYPKDVGKVSVRLFDSVVFNDSIKEFLSLKKKLANYFDENNTEDIFDYIPPQRTNQIFTPKWVVKKMVDMLEEENPGCFDNPDKTFIDLYMKSGLYITEIVKKLYNSEKMKEAYPDSHQRLKHIFEKQVYGLAPTEIIYRIAISFILGFDENLEIQHHNLKCADALPYAINGNMEELLEELYG